MRARHAALGAVVVGALVLATGAFAAPTAQQVMQKLKQSMTSAKTYQATVQSTMSMGQMGSMALKTTVKTAGSKTYTRTQPVGQPSGQMAMGAMMADSEVVDNGQTAYVYLIRMKQYMKRPHGQSGQQMFAMDLKNIPTVDPKMNYKLLSPERVGGRPVYVVEVTPKAPQPGRGSQKYVFCVDQSTYRLKQARISMPMGQNGTMNIVSTVVNDSVNAPISPSTFEFKPPAGATEMKGGPMGGMGAPGGGPRRPGGMRPPGGR